MRCAECNGNIPDGLNYCPMCGCRLHTEYGVGTRKYTSDVDSPEHVVFKDAVRLFFRNYANFGGRSTRSEFWNAWLFVAVVTAPLLIFVSQFDIGLLKLLAFTAIAIPTGIPSLSLLVRRFHDTGRSAAGVLIGIYGSLSIGAGVVVITALVAISSLLGSLFSGDIIHDLLHGEGVFGVSDTIAGVESIAFICAGVALLLLAYTLVVCCLPSDPYPNKYGREPRD